MTQFEQARVPIDSRAEIVAPAQFRAADVDGHTDIQTIDRRPVLLAERALRGHSGLDRIGGALEQNSTAAGLPSYFPAVLRRGFANECIVPRDRPFHGGAIFQPTRA